MRRTTRRLSIEQFDAAAGRLSLKDAALTLARAVMVEGTPVTPLAQAAGLSRQALSKITARVYRAHLESLEAPPTWRSVTVCVPVDRVDAVRAIEQEARQTHAMRRQIAASIATLHQGR